LKERENEREIKNENGREEIEMQRVWRGDFAFICVT